MVSALQRARTDPAFKRTGELTVVRSIEAPDAATVVIRTHFPFGALPHRLAGVSIWREGARPDDPPLGTGPFRVRHWRPGGDTELEAWAGYHGGAPAIPGLTFLVMPDVEERLRALRVGRVHLLVDVPPEAFDGLASQPRVRTISETGLRVLFLVMDTRARRADGSANPFHDVRARRAVALAIDRRRLVAEALGGHGALVDQIVGAGVFGYDRELPPLTNHRPDDAKALLGQTGGGFATVLDFMPRKYQAMEVVVASMTADLARIGIRVEPRRWETAEFFRRVESRASPFYVMGWLSTGGEATVSYNYLVRTPRGGHGVDNGGAYSSPEVDALLAQATSTLSPAARLQLLSRVARKLQADVSVIPLYCQSDLYAAAAELEFVPRIDRRIRGHELHWVYTKKARGEIAPGRSFAFGPVGPTHHQARDSTFAFLRTGS